MQIKVTIFISGFFLMVQKIASFCMNFRHIVTGIVDSKIYFGCVTNNIFVPNPKLCQKNFLVIIKTAT